MIASRLNSFCSSFFFHLRSKFKFILSIKTFCSAVFFVLFRFVFTLYFSLTHSLTHSMHISVFVCLCFYFYLHAFRENKKSTTTSLQLQHKKEINNFHYLVSHLEFKFFIRENSNLYKQKLKFLI